MPTSNDNRPKTELRRSSTSPCSLPPQSLHHCLLPRAAATAVSDWFFSSGKARPDLLQLRSMLGILLSRLMSALASPSSEMGPGYMRCHLARGSTLTLLLPPFSLPHILNTHRSTSIPFIHQQSIAMRTLAVTLALLVAFLSTSGGARLSTVRTPDLSPSPAPSRRDINTLESDPHPPASAVTVPQDPTKTRVHNFDVDPSTVVNHPEIDGAASKDFNLANGGANTAYDFRTCTDLSAERSCRNQT